MKYTKQNIKETNNPDFLFFWGHTTSQLTINKACLSQWYPSEIALFGEEFKTAEHLMMYHKARFFGDTHAMEQILKADHPKIAKKWGRLVTGFDSKVWDENKYEIVKDVNLLKFTQNIRMAEFLLNTGNKILVEASPYDPVWGIGMKSTDDGVYDVDQWKGENLLGFALMEVRDLIKIGRDLNKL